MAEIAENLARRFHDIYEKLAPDFGYETRQETRLFDPQSPNGQLMIATCETLLAPVPYRLDQLETFVYESGDGETYANIKDVAKAMELCVLEDIGTDATEEMCDSVRYLLVGMESPGQTFAGIRKHCEMSGMDTSHWPSWILDPTRQQEHFNKSARAALIWHCMAHARLFGYKDD